MIGLGKLACLGPCCGLLVSLVLWRPFPQERLRGTHTPSSEAALPDLTTPRFRSDHSFRSWTDREFFQAFEVHGRTLLIEEYVLDSPTGGPMLALQHVETAPFVIRRFAAVRDAFLVSGPGTGGAYVLQLWRLRKVESSAKNRVCYLDRSELYRASDAGSMVTAVQLDPELRFAMMIVEEAGEASLFQVPIGGEATPTELARSPAFPELLGADTFGRGNHPIFGRVWFTEARGHLGSVLLLDSDNNGVFDGLPTGTTVPALSKEGYFRGFDSLNRGS